MATNRLQIRLDAVDNTQRAFKKIQGSLGGVRGAMTRLKTTVFSLKGALVSLGAGLVIRSIVNVGRQIEELGLRFKFLFGSAQEGARALDELVTFAAKVPFTLEQIQQGAGNLAVVTKNAEELAQMLKITGNVAAVTGLDFRTTAEQIQRSFSAGIGAADLFRDRGVRAMLGFKAGAQVSIEETQQRFKELFGEGGVFGNATDQFATTLTGTLSMLQDKLFKVQKAISDGFFSQLKIEFNALNGLLEDNEVQIDQFATAIGEQMATALRKFAQAIKFVSDNLQELKIALGALLIIFGTAVKAIAGILLAFDGLIRKTDDLIKSTDAYKKSVSEIELDVIYDDFPVKKLNESTKNLLNTTQALANENSFIYNQEQKINQERAKARLEQEKMSKALSDLKSSLPFINEESKKFFNSFQTILSGQLKNRIQELDEQFKNFKVTLATGIVEGITALSRGLAQSIILGRKLGDVMKQFVQNAIVNILAKFIEYYLQKLALFLLEKLFGIELKDQLDFETQKLAIMKKQTSELKKQAGLRIILAFLGAAEGGQVRGRKADGGQVTGYRQAGGGTTQTGAYVVGERGRELFIPNQDGEIVSNERLQQLGTNVNFTINATDVKGVKELLIDNRAVIVNIINSALNQKGKAALV